MKSSEAMILAVMNAKISSFVPRKRFASYTLQGHVLLIEKFWWKSQGAGCRSLWKTRAAGSVENTGCRSPWKTNTIDPGTLCFPQTPAPRVFHRRRHPVFPIDPGTPFFPHTPAPRGHLIFVYRDLNAG